MIDLRLLKVLLDLVEVQFLDHPIEKPTADYDSVRTTDFEHIPKEAQQILVQIMIQTKNLKNSYMTNERKLLLKTLELIVSTSVSLFTGGQLDQKRNPPIICAPCHPEDEYPPQLADPEEYFLGVDTLGDRYEEYEFDDPEEE